MRHIVNRKLFPALVRHHSVLSLLAREKRFPWTSVDLSNNRVPWQSLGFGDGLWTDRFDTLYMQARTVTWRILADQTADIYSACTAPRTV